MKGREGKGGDWRVLRVEGEEEVEVGKEGRRRGGEEAAADTARDRQ